MNLKSYLLKGDKQALQQSPRRLFWYKKNAEADNLEVLLYNNVVIWLGHLT